jgi:hypothetical protein
MALSYTSLSAQSADPIFRGRVEFALLQDVKANRLQSLPPDTSDVTQAAQEDRLGRAIIASPLFWAEKFSTLVAIQLIGKTTLLDESVTTDGDIFSAVSAVFDKYLPSRG